MTKDGYYTSGEFAKNPMEFYHFVPLSFFMFL